MLCHQLISKSQNNCGDQGAEKLGESISKLVNISYLFLDLR